MIGTIIFLGVFVLIIFLIYFLVKRFLKNERNNQTLFGEVIGFSKKFSELKFFMLKEKKEEDESNVQENKADKKGGSAEGGKTKIKIRENKKTKKNSEVFDDEDYFEEEFKKEEKKEKFSGDKKGSFVIYTITDVISKIKDKEISGILKYLQKMNYDIEKDLLNREFSSKEELRKFLKQYLVTFLRNQTDFLKEKISFFRRKGKDVQYEWFKALRISLKIKIFEASFTRRDFERVIKNIKNIEESLKKYDDVLKKQEEQRKNAVKEKKTKLSREETGGEQPQGIKESKKESESDSGNPVKK